MFEGIYLWDAKYGIPTDPNDLDSIEAFINELQEKPQEANANLYGFAQIFGEFLHEASHFYPEDEAINQNKGIALLTEGSDIDVVLYLDGTPRDSYEYFYSVLDHAASLYNLVQWDPLNNTLTLPMDPKTTEYKYKLWQQQLIKLKEPPNTEEEELPKTIRQVNRLAAKILKEYLPKVGINNTEVTSDEIVEVSINTDQTTVSLNNFFETDMIYRYENNKTRVYYKATIQIQINGFQFASMFINYPHFMKIPYHSKAFQEFEIYTVTELKQHIAESVKMLTYLYPHMQSDDSLCKFLLNAKNDKHLSRHYFIMLQHISQPELYLFAHRTNQPNLPELYETLKQEYIDDSMFGLQEEEEFHNIYYEERQKENSKYTKIPFCKPENPEAEYAKKFDDKVTHWLEIS